MYKSVHGVTVCVFVWQLDSAGVYKAMIEFKKVLLWLRMFQGMEDVRRG